MVVVWGHNWCLVATYLEWLPTYWMPSYTVEWVTIQIPVMNAEKSGWKSEKAQETSLWFVLLLSEMPQSLCYSMPSLQTHTTGWFTISPQVQGLRFPVQTATDGGWPTPSENGSHCGSFQTIWLNFVEHCNINSSKPASNLLVWQFMMICQYIQGLP